MSQRHIYVYDRSPIDVEDTILEFDEQFFTGTEATLIYHSRSHASLHTSGWQVHALIIIDSQ